LEGVYDAPVPTSRDATPSPEDRQLTTRLKQAADIIGIRMLDHVIIGESSHYSFADNGCLS
jgi:DNA repair protein RadC